MRIMKTIRVVAAVIYDKDRIFATQRGYGAWKDYWEFPGGKIEPGESPEEALCREIREELDTEILVGEKLTDIEYDYPEFHLSMQCFWAKVVEGSLDLKEHEAARWLQKEDLDSVNWLPADKGIIDLLRVELLRRGEVSIMREETVKRILRFTEDRDWDQFHSPANLAKSIAIEAGELLECFQWSDTDYKLEDVRDELADVMVYCIDMLDKLGLDADEIINAKMDKNEAKYPVDKAKGSAKKYTEF